MLLCSNCLNAAVNWKLPRIVTRQPCDLFGPPRNGGRPLAAVSVAVAVAVVAPLAVAATSFSCLGRREGRHGSEPANALIPRERHI